VEGFIKVYAMEICILNFVLTLEDLIAVMASSGDKRTWKIISNNLLVSKMTTTTKCERSRDSSGVLASYSMSE
jgi:hypothetical protein